MGENKHLTPVWIVYVDGKRLDTDHEGALERIVIDDKLNGVGTGVLEFDSSMIKIRDSGTFSLESYVSVHLGYKDDCEQVFAGEVTEFKGDFSEYGHERVKVVCKNCLHKLQNALQSLSFEAKSPAAVLKERLGVYGLKGEIEDFGAVRNYFVESGLSDYEYLLQTARKYGKTVYGYDDTVYIKDEVTVSDEEVILEWGKSLISFRCSENLKGQLSSCTFVGWDENNCEGITGSAGLSDIPVKVGGDSSWEDNSKGASGTWKAVFTADDLYDNEDAKNRAIGYLQNISMEYQTGVGKCEGNRYIFPGMRVTIKYVGEHFSGEYIAERVVHEVSVNGPFTTEVYVKRNMSEGEEQEGSSMFHVEESVDSAGEFTNTMLYQDDYGNLTDDPYAITGRNIGEPNPILLDENIRNIAENHMGEAYAVGNMCDDFVYKILNEASIPCELYFAGAPSTTTVKEHIEKAKKSVLFHMEPVPGANVVFMGDGTTDKTRNREHCALLFLNEGGSVDVYHNSRSNDNESSAKEKYGSIEEFKDDFLYESFYYLEV